MMIGSAVRMLAIRMGNVAFLLPLNLIEPCSGAPP
jgi:hypothetical protein